MRKPISEIRREYGELSLCEKDVSSCPIEQFERWFSKACECELYDDPTAMLLSTIDSDGFPDSRVVLLKSVLDKKFVFYTNYNSKKAKQIQKCSNVALTFYWPGLCRQVRVLGKAKKINAELSDKYFSTRPKNSQLGALASDQSKPIASREQLESKLARLIDKHGQEAIMRPEHWGGFEVTAHKVEFWQGRDNRLHDRICYCEESGQWNIVRLQP